MNLTILVKQVKVCVIDYGMGNLTSVMNAIRHLQLDVELVSDPNAISGFDCVLLPGVGAFPKAMKILNDTGLGIAIINAAERGKTVVGICLGMQLLFTKSLEFGETKGLNLIKGQVVPFRDKINVQIPHMGWNSIFTKNKEFESFTGDYYFVHSYYCMPENNADELFTTNYEIDFCSAVQKNRIFGFQFHPEKSQQPGLNLLKKALTGC